MKLHAIASVKHVSNENNHNSSSELNQNDKNGQIPAISNGQLHTNGIGENPRHNSAETCMTGVESLEDVRPTEKASSRPSSAGQGHAQGQEAATAQEPTNNNDANNEAQVIKGYTNYSIFPMEGGDYSKNVQCILDV